MWEGGSAETVPEVPAQGCCWLTCAPAHQWILTPSLSLPLLPVQAYQIYGQAIFDSMGTHGAVLESQPAMPPMAVLSC